MEKGKNMPMLKNLEDKFDMKFDYEINKTRMDDHMDCKMYYDDENDKEKEESNTK